MGQSTSGGSACWGVTWLRWGGQRRSCEQVPRPLGVSFPPGVGPSITGDLPHPLRELWVQSDSYIRSWAWVRVCSSRPPRSHPPWESGSVSLTPAGCPVWGGVGTSGLGASCLPPPCPAVPPLEPLGSPGEAGGPHLLSAGSGGGGHLPREGPACLSWTWLFPAPHVAALADRYGSEGLPTAPPAPAALFFFHSFYAAWTVLESGPAHTSQSVHGFRT